MKKKELEKKLEELKIKYQLLLLFNGQITNICIKHISIYKKINMDDLDQVQLADLFLNYNIHTFTSYFGKYYFGKYKVDLEENGDFLDGWNKQMKEFFNPLYLKELDTLKKRLEAKKTPQSYVS